MKKIRLQIPLFIATFFLATPSVYAAEGLSSSHLQVSPEESFSVSLQLEAAAAWNVHISSSGPVSGCNLIDADVTEDALNTEKTFSIDCTATEVGTITVTLSGDYTTEDRQTTTLSDSLEITVAEKSNTTTDEEKDSTKEEITEKEETTGGSSPNTGTRQEPNAKAELAITQEISIVILFVTILAILAISLSLIKKQNNK